ncbi:MAG: hypothetical protein RLZZ347_186 [Candidatus Parcubacteria bacterium]|jgi:hypothetical protein
MSRQHFRSWEEIWKIIDPNSLIGTTVEVWYTPPEAMSFTADEKAEAELTGYFRFCIIGVRVGSEHNPFVTGQWYEYDKTSNAWKASGAEIDCMHVKERGGLSRITVSDGKITSVHPKLNIHVIFHPREKPVPLNHGRAITVAEIFELFQKRAAARN